MFHHHGMFFVASWESSIGLDVLQMRQNVLASDCLDEQSLDSGLVSWSVPIWQAPEWCANLPWFVWRPNTSHHLGPVLCLSLLRL